MSGLSYIVAVARRHQHRREQDRVRLRTAREIGLRIRDRRMQLGLSQAELAERVGMTRQWVIGLEKGAPGAALGTVLRTLSELGLVLDISVPDPGPRNGASTSAREVPVDHISRFVNSVGSRGRNNPDTASNQNNPDARSARNNPGTKSHPDHGRNAPSRTPLNPAKKK
jgi:HTH-type transcriptional regulator/antitoxin HipB